MKKQVEIDFGDDKKVIANLSIPMDEYEELRLIALDYLGNLKPWIDFDSNTIHKVFANQTKYMAVITGIPATNEETNQTRTVRMKIVKDNLEELLKLVKEFSDLNQNLNTVYYYFPDVKYILLIRPEQYCCIDYGNYNHESPGDTPVIVIKGAEGPLDTRKNIVDLVRIKDLIKDAKDLFKTNININDVDNNSCNYCQTDKIKLSICSRCKTRYYCSQECQKSDWPEHKKICKRLDVIIANTNQEVDIKLFIPKKKK